MRWGKFIFSFSVTVVLGYFLIVPIASIPFSLGPFFNPFKGFWQNAVSTQSLIELPNSLPQLQQPVEVAYNDRGVPFVFAENEGDAYFMQGYITARDRLWQMEFQAYAAGGRLSEIMPVQFRDALLTHDREMRRKGLPYAARKSWETIINNPKTRTILAAYTAGVNAYIRTLSPAQLPLEYKILGYEPEPWTPYKSCLLLKYMANMLAGRAHDIANTRNLKEMGQALFDTLYGEPYPVLDPIIPEAMVLPDSAWEPVQSPASYQPDDLLTWRDYIPAGNTPVGSNNWAVSGSKTHSGVPLLANDPHLGLSIPSIWYEIQLTIGDKPVYGVSLPGSPGVVIGFNDAIAWGLTNSGRDVFDFFALEFQDDTQSAYRYNGEWMPIQRVVDTILQKGGTMYLDTVMYTHFGPVMYDHAFGGFSQPLAARWTAYEASNELLTLYKLNQAQNYEHYVDAIQHFVAPAQNFVFAGKGGDIAIWQQGAYVNRWPGQGRFILSASDSTHHWGDFLPFEYAPHMLNPERGFVSSANQRPTDESFPYFYHGTFQQYRNRRLNYLLSTQDSVGMGEMKAIQLDNFGLLAAEILPVLMGDIDASSLSTQEREAFDLLQKWDYYFHPEAIAPSIFQSWWDRLYATIWEDEFDPGTPDSEWPGAYRTTQLLMDYPHFSLFDDRGTDKVENRRVLANQTFRAVIKELSDQDPEIQNWTWKAWKKTSIRHLGRLSPALGRNNLPIGGYRDILNATAEHHGPSWRMVVSLGPEIEAEAIYPGGQSGSPASPLYDNAVDDWAAGNYYPIRIIKKSKLDEGNWLFRKVITN